MRERFSDILEKLHRLPVLRAVRRGLITLIPILMIGSLSLVLKSLPVKAYLTVITTWGDGILYSLFDMIYHITFGMLAVYMAAVIGYHFGLLDAKAQQNNRYGTLLVSVGCFFIMSGSSGNFDAFGPKGMFIAILSACLASSLYIFVAGKLKNRVLLSDGADIRLGNAIWTIKPALMVFIVFALANLFLTRIFQVDSVYELLINAVNNVFKHMGQGLPLGFSFVVASGILWFFGIHGGNALEGVADSMFRTATQTNIELASQGKAATEILTKEFFDHFVLMGGCGTTLCLLFALLFFSRRRSTRGLMKMSLFPALFNVNEIMVFGLPIVYNPVFFLPFLGVPIFCFFNTYFAMSMGLVPLVTKSVEWTTPVFISGYFTTGSVWGAVLQLVNLCVGIALYVPFVKIYDREKLRNIQREYDELVECLQESERTREPVRVTDDRVSYGNMGKALAADLVHALETEGLMMFYQPQYRDDGECIGAEALMRWKHSVLGNIYPPLIFKMAEETGMLEELEEWVVRQVVKDAKRLHKSYPDRKLKISVNVTGVTIQCRQFERFLKTLAEQENVRELGICIEITEQAVLKVDEELTSRFFRIREFGYMLAVDDFSMGSTSIQYLTGNHFHLLKLDGLLVKGILDNERCRDIIASIVQLSDTLGVEVLAEFVSSSQIRDKLRETGCTLYQGWYYSPAVEFEVFHNMVEEKKK